MASHLWNTFIQIYESATRINIVFDLYILNSIKNDEEDRRGSINGIRTSIHSSEQILPVEMDLFWVVSENKMTFQQFFIELCVKNYSNDKTIYLREAHSDDITGCLKITGKSVVQHCLLKCDHEEADDQMMFHVNHAIKAENYKNLVIASGDTGVFVCALYHFGRWICSGLKELSIIAGKSNVKFAILVRTIFDQLDTEVADILPAMHVLTDCHTTSNVETKASGLQAVIEEGQKLLFDFERGEFSEKMIPMVEYFLTKCASHATNLSNI